MQVIAQWTGGQADALRQALRMTIEAFAEHLGVAPRTVAYWRKQPTIVPQTAIQEALDSTLEAAPDRAKAQFALLIGEAHRMHDSNTADHTEALAVTLDALGPDPDEQARIRGVVHAPSRLDGATVAHLTQGLYGQRHAEDSLGSSVMIAPMRAQLDTLVTLLREASGPHRPALYNSWRTGPRLSDGFTQDFASIPRRTLYLLTWRKCQTKLEMARLASTGTSYRGYLALLQGRHRAAIRATTAALGTPGAHSVQLAYDTLQAAQAYAGLGDIREAKNLLHRASDRVTNAGDPPESLYWYTEPFLRMNIGLTQHAIGQYRDAVDSLTSGMAELPADQRNAEWLDEYQQALDYATDQTDGPAPRQQH